MKLASVNGVNVCKLVFNSEMDFSSLALTFSQTIYQVDGLQ